MSKKVLLLTPIIIAVFCAAIFIVLKQNKPFAENKIEAIKYDNFHYASTNNKDNYGGLEKIAPTKNIGEKIYGGIVSHHLLAALEIAEFFVNLKQQKIKTFVIIGPNHFNRGDGNVFISKYPYQTSWGIIEPNNEIIEKIIGDNLAVNDENVFEGEHSISALVGFIKYVFPKAKIVPLVVKKETSITEAENLANELNRILPPDVFILASVDFSHHLNRIAADFHDQKSISTIENFNFENVYNLEIDSPPSIYTLLKYLEKRGLPTGKAGAQKIDYKNINSAVLTGNLNSEDVTTYLFAYFMKGAPKSNEAIAILNFGDAMFGRAVGQAFLKGRNPFEFIRGREGNFLKGFDLATLNLEGPITDNINYKEGEMSFKFNPAIVKTLFDNKINAVNLANNHILNCGKSGLSDTKKYLTDFKINYFGDFKHEQSYFIKETSGKKIAFMGIDQTLGLSNLDNFYALAKKLRAENDYLIVNIHWGYEYNIQPSKMQKEIAYNLIDNGTDVIIGHHPHVIQSAEIYKDGVIFYSLGNFIFDQILPNTKKGLGVGIILKETERLFYLFPYQIANYQPKLLSYSETSAFCNNYLKELKNNIKDICVLSF